MEVNQLNVEIKDFPNICRVCLHFVNLESSVIINNINKIDSCNAIDTLNSVAGIQIEEDDKLPKNICDSCIRQLNDIAAFIKFCKSNDTYLKELFIGEENKYSLQETDSPLCDNFEDDDNFDKIDKTLLSERKIQINPEDTLVILEETNKRSLRKGKKRAINLGGTKKRVEECECKICGKRFTRRGGLKRHSKIHLAIKPFECETCGKTFVEKATLNRHYLIHTGEKPFECNLCGKTTTRKDQILEHINKHHPNAVNCDFVITERKRNYINKKENCNEKQSNNESANKAENRKDNTNNMTESEIDDADTKNQIKFEMNKVEDTNIKVKEFKTKKRIEICLCNLCGKVFRRRGYLKNHMAIHASIKPFKCDICGKGFTQRHALTRHNLVHTKERPFQCNLCGKTFTRKEILMDHLKNHREGSKPYLCFHCGKCFSNKDYLSKHLKYYLPGKGKKKNNSDKNKCICPQCGKQLHSVSYLKTHLLTHTGEKPYQCNVCGNRFTVLRSLNHHLKIHVDIKPYPCTQCEKVFRTSGSLKQHVLLHTGERPFKCTSCEKGFIRRSHLKRHLRIH